MNTNSRPLPIWAYIVIGIPAAFLWLLMVCASSVLFMEVIHRLGGCK